MRKVLLVGVFVLVPIAAFAGKIATISGGPGTFSASVIANTGKNPGFSFTEANNNDITVTVNPPAIAKSAASFSFANSGAASGIIVGGKPLN
jgi:hypothetical protein